jgi:hypothetical protein
MGGTVELFAEPEQAPSSAQLERMGESAEELEASTGAIVDTSGGPPP